MAKSKVIEDSDGDDDEPESPPPPASGLTDLSLSNIVDLQSSSTVSASNILQYGDASTASTEVLNREIKNAHKRLMEPASNSDEPFTEPISLSQQTPESPSVSKQHRKRANSASESLNPRVKKAAKTRAYRPDRDTFEFHGSSDGESGIAVDLRDGAGNDLAAGTNMRPPSTKSALASGSSLSTIAEPKAARSIRSNERLSHSVSNETPKSLAASLSDGRMPTPTVSSRGRSDNGVSPSADQTQIDLCSSVIAALPTVLGSGSQQELSSNASLISPNTTIHVEKVADRMAGLRDEDIDDDELSRPSPGFHTAGTINPIVLLPQRRPHSELSIEALNESNGDVETQSNGKRNQDAKNNADDLGSDDMDIGIPKEQYQPRPSRSRRGVEYGHLVTPIGFSKKPETVGKDTIKPKAKRKKKRSMTTAFQELRPPKDEDENDEDEDDVLKKEFPQLEIPSRKHQTSKMQLKQLVEDEEKPDEPPVTETEPVADTVKPKKQRGRPKKTREANENRPRTKAAEETTNSDLLMEEPRNTTVTKRGCKRGKAVELSRDIVDEDENDSSAEAEEESSSQDQAAKGDRILEESTGNTASIQSQEDAPKDGPLLKESMAPPETPSKPTAGSLPKAPDKHSPISSGKVAHRVGLSKRARIAPLLRIMRK